MFYCYFCKICGKVTGLDSWLYNKTIYQLQIHIIEPNIENYGVLDRPCSAPALVSKYPAMDYQHDTRHTDPTRNHEPRLGCIDLRLSGDKTVEFTSLDYQLYPTPHHKLLSSCWTDSKIKYKVRDKTGRGLSFVGGDGTGHRFRTRSCWESSKGNGLAAAQFGS